MSDVPAKWFTEPVSVATFTGNGSLGPVFADQLTDRGNVDPTRQLVRTASGAQVVSEMTIGVPPTFAGQPSLEVFTPESTVTVDGETSTVIAVQAFRKFGVIQYVAVTV